MGTYLPVHRGNRAAWLRFPESSILSLLMPRREVARNRLMPTVLTVGFFPVLIEGNERRGISYREEDGPLASGGIVMLVPGPTGYHEHIPLLPGEARAVDDRLAASFMNVIDHAADVPVGLGLDAGPQ